MSSVVPGRPCSEFSPAVADATGSGRRRAGRLGRHDTQEESVDVHENWSQLKDEEEAQREAERWERQEARRAEWRATSQEAEDSRLEELDTGRGRSGLHVKHGVHSEDMPAGNWSTGMLLAAERRQGTVRTVGIGNTVCPLSAESIFDCPIPTCDHPAPGEVVR